jgi:hypothetical protein
MIARVIALLLLTGTAHAQWSWQVFTYGQDLYFASYLDGAEQFDFQVGGGGCIQQMRYAPAGFVSMFAQENPGEPINQTDAVLQEVWSASKIQYPIPAQFGASVWNVNQSGNFANTFSPVVAVQYNRAGNYLDVWSVANWQWVPEEAPYLGGGIPMLTRYTFLPNGVLDIRRVWLAPGIIANGAEVPSYDIADLGWLPLARDPVFNTLIFSFAQSGEATSLKLPSTDATKTDYLQAQKTDGHVTAWSGHNQPVLALVTGTAQPSNYSAASALYSVMVGGWRCGIFVTTILALGGITPGTIVDEDYQILARASETPEFLSTLASQTQSVQAPAIYPAGYDLSATDLTSIVGELRVVGSQPFVQTNHLGPYLHVQ